MKFVILTGMSGAGKSTALKIFEDIGYFCVDNLPIPLIEKFSELAEVQDTKLSKVAVGVDIRSGKSMGQLEAILKKMRVSGKKFNILFLDADDTVLVKRYKETRRSHPLTRGERVDKGIQLEREKLDFLKKQADFIIDTSQLLTRELRAEIENIYLKHENFQNLYITILSFGFKYGIPVDSDLVFDVRCLPNPFYDEKLKPQTGNDKPVQDFVMKHEVSHILLDKLEDMLKFLIPNYIKEGKNQLIISIGCTGGKHRSVTLANELFNRLKDEEGYGIKIEHRDIGKDALRGV